MVEKFRFIQFNPEVGLHINQKLCLIYSPFLVVLFFSMIFYSLGPSLYRCFFIWKHNDIVLFSPPAYMKTIKIIIWKPKRNDLKTVHFETHPCKLGLNPILDGVRAHPILDGGGGAKKPPVLTLPFSIWQQWNLVGM